MKRIVAVASMAALVAGCSNAAEQAVRAELIDPESAEFREVKTCTGDSSITRGEVNGKNRLGAYTGFEFFFVEDGRVYFAGTDGVMEVMDRCYGSSAKEAMEDAAADADAMERAATSKGKWDTNTKRDPIDDSAVVTASLDADSGSSSFGETVSIVARCGSNKTELYAIWNDYVGDDSSSPYYEYKRVEVRVGTAAAETQLWDVSTDSQATFARDPIPLLKDMVQNEKLALRMTPYGENPVTAIFDLTGIEAAIKPIAEECNWEL